MKKSELFFTAALVPLDIFSLFLAGIAAYTLRFHPFFTDLRPVLFDTTLQEFGTILFPMILLWIGIFALSGLYSTKPPRLAHELLRIFLACSTSMAVLFALLFFSRSLFESRFIVLAAWGFSILFVSLERLLLRAFQRFLLSKGIGQHRIAIIGNTTSTEMLMEEFEKKHRLGFDVIAHYPHFDEHTKQKLIQLKTKNFLEEILLADPHLSSEQTLELVAFCDSEHLCCKYTADLFAAAIGKTDMAMYAGIPILEIKKTPLDGWGAIYKRTFDISIALFLLLLTLPLTVFTGIFILLESGRPIIFKNERVGEKGRLFKTLKFRSMKQEFSVGTQKKLGDQKQALALEEKLIAEQSKQGPIYKIKNDPRVTPFGSFIRKYSIDELPQLINILFGTMSLVGPRPHQPREVQNYKTHHLKVHTLKPGLTGLAQISGRSDLAFEQEMRLDLYYIEHWSPWLDFSILIKTPLVVLFRKGSY